MYQSESAQYALEKLAIPNSENLQFHILSSTRYSLTKQDQRALCKKKPKPVFTKQGGKKND